MNNPEQIQGPAGETPAGESRPSQRLIDQPMDLALAVSQLRGLVCGLGAGLLVVSLALSAFVLKQNRNLAATIGARQRQISQLRTNQQQIAYVVSELARYSVGKPELMALFKKHGVQIAPTPTSTEPASGPSTSPP